MVWIVRFRKQILMFQMLPITTENDDFVRPSIFGSYSEIELNVRCACLHQIYQICTVYSVQYTLVSEWSDTWTLKSISLFHSIWRHAYHDIKEIGDWKMVEIRVVPVRQYLFGLYIGPQSTLKSTVESPHNIYLWMKLIG